MTFPAPHLLPLGVLLLIGAIWDIAKRRVPNWVTGAVAVLGLAAQLVDHGALAAGSGLLAAVVSVALLWRPWMAGGLGGGDVKLAAAVAIWVGLSGMIRYALAVAAVGGVVAIVTYFFLRKSIRQDVKTNLTLAALQQTLPTVEARSPGRVSVPYALAIAAGAAVALLT